MSSKQATTAAEESLAMFEKSGLRVWTGDDAPWRCAPPASNLKVLALTDGQACTATVRGRTPYGDEVLGGVSIGCTSASDCTLRETLTCMRPDVVPTPQPATGTKR
jgi:hypothetical protein